MRDIVGHYIEQLDGGYVRLTRSEGGLVDGCETDDWHGLIDWLVERPAGEDSYFTVCFSLTEFVKILFSLLPPDIRELTEKQDRVQYGDTKIFYIKGRVLGITYTAPINLESNLWHKSEINLYSLESWLPDKDPTNALEVELLGKDILSALDQMDVYPTRLTSPASVFTDCLGPASDYPTIWSFNDIWFEAMEYATEVMRFEWRSAYKVGSFPKTYQYDINSAYPASIALLPDTDNCQCVYSKERPKNWWGIMKGKITVDTDVSPFVFDTGTTFINPKGTWEGYFTTKEIDWLNFWEAGSFVLEDGWFFKFNKDRPYHDKMNRLLVLKQSNDPNISTIAKRMSQGMSGKLDEDHQNGTYGDFYNPILAAMVRSHCRVKVADFICTNELEEHLIAVLVDSVLATKPVKLPSNGRMGSWRDEGEAPAIVLSKGRVWRPGKKPLGIEYDDLIRALYKEPDNAYFEFPMPSGRVRALDFLVDDLDRDFVLYPSNGRELMSGFSDSVALGIG